MTDLKIGIQLACLRQPLKTALLTASQLGAQAVVIDARHELRPEEFTQTALRHLRKMLDDLNLKVSALTFPTRRGYGEPDALENRLAATQRAMQFAHQLGASVLIGRIGAVPEEEEGTSWTTLLDSLSTLGAYGHHVGATLAAKTDGVSDSDLVRLLAALPEGAVGVDLDPAGLIAGGHSPQEAAGVLGPNVLHVTASDRVRDLAQSRTLEVALGRGSADFPALLGALEEHRYRGWYTVARHQTDDPVTEIGNAIQYLRSL